MRNYLSRNELLSLVVFLLLFPIVPTFGQSDSGFVVTRLNNGQPIIDQTMFAAVGAEGEGANINGPSLIRIPDWILPSERADPSAVYYLYFAHHAGATVALPLFLTETKSTHRTHGFLLPVMGSNF